MNAYISICNTNPLIILIMRSNKVILIALLLLSFSMSKGQSKSELKNQIKDLNLKLETLSKEKETLAQKIDRFEEVKIDDVITAEDQPQNIIVGEGGWRIELNALKYKSDLIGQLGTLWVLNDSGQLMPQGAIKLSGYNIDPLIINPDKEVVYKNFISKGTTMDGDGGAPFAQLSASLKANEYSNFTINIEGTSLIKTAPADLKKIAIEADDSFTLPNVSSVWMCTGMHVIKYHSTVFSKTDGVGKISSPVVTIGGSFFAESNKEATQYLVVRQLTQLNQQKLKTSTNQQIIAQVKSLINSPISSSEYINKMKSFSPVDVLTFILEKEPTFEQTILYQSDPEKFINSVVDVNTLSDKVKVLLDKTKQKIVSLPKMVRSVE